MPRFARILLVATASLLAGVCAGAGQVHVISRLAQPTNIAVSNAVPDPEPTAGLSVRDISVADLLIAPIAQAAAEPARPSCDFLAKIDELEGQVASVSLQVGTKKYTYTEKRSGGVKTRSEPEIQIALGLLNKEMCATRIVTVTKRGSELISPSGYRIEVVCRKNGICWNDWNTSYRVIEPAGWFVIGNDFPHLKDTSITRFLRAASGKLVRRTTTMSMVVRVFYNSYSQELHTREMVAAGPAYQAQLSQHSDERLRRAGVQSRAFPGKRLVDVLVLKPEYAERRMPIEYMDQEEFDQNPEWTTDRIQILIGANRDRFGVYTCSPKKACGPRQFIKSTWQLVVGLAPSAGLDHDFARGASDPVQAMMATRILDDYNLSLQKKYLTPKQFADLVANPHLTEEVLAAMYNSGSKRVIPVIAAYLDNPSKWTDWTEATGKGRKAHLVAETKGYVARKLRYLRDEWPAGLAMAASSPNQ